jgi:hypothetical protein
LDEQDFRRRCRSRPGRGRSRRLGCATLRAFETGRPADAARHRPRPAELRPHRGPRFRAGPGHRPRRRPRPGAKRQLPGRVPRHLPRLRQGAGGRSAPVGPGAAGLLADGRYLRPAASRRCPLARGPAHPRQRKCIAFWALPRQKAVGHLRGLLGRDVGGERSRDVVGTGFLLCFSHRIELLRGDPPAAGRQPDRLQRGSRTPRRGHSSRTSGPRGAATAPRPVASGPGR